MRTWDVTFELRIDVHPAALEDLADELVGWLADVDGVLTIREQRLLVDVTIDARDHARAVSVAWASARAAFEHVGRALRPRAIDRVEAIDADVARARLSDATYPQMLGVSEVADMLEVSKQRVFQLRDEGRLPTPIAELRAGPVWPAPAIEQWLSTWERKPGRPPRAASG